MNIKNFLIGFFANPAIAIADEAFEKFLENFYTKKPKAAVAFASALYIGIDVFAEEYVATTKTDIDDKLVAEFKKDLVEFAAKHNFELVNLDAD